MPLLDAASNTSRERRDQPAPNNSWFFDNFLAPAINEGAIKPFNAIANIVNGVTRCESITKRDEYEVPEVQSTGQAFVQGLASAAGIIPYVVAGRLVGEFARPMGGAAFRAGLINNPILAGETFSMLGGVVAYDSVRDLKPGQTR